MTWVLVAVMCGAIAYSARLLMDFIAFEHEILPAIDRLNDQADKLTTEAEWEAEERGKLKERLKGLRETVEEMQARSEKAKKELKTEQTLFRRLELEANRQHIRQRRRVAVG